MMVSYAVESSLYAFCVVVLNWSPGGRDSSACMACRISADMELVLEQACLAVKPIRPGRDFVVCSASIVSLNSSIAFRVPLLLKQTYRPRAWPRPRFPENFCAGAAMMWPTNVAGPRVGICWFKMLSYHSQRCCVSLIMIGRKSSIK